MWGLSPQELDNETTNETIESRLLNSPKHDQDEIDSFHPYRKCGFVHTERQFADVRERVTKTSFSSLD